MISYTTTILKYDEQGDKTGWTYIEVPADIAQAIKPGNKKTFAVKGKLDQHPIKQTSMLPIGNGTFIIPLNAAIRKAIGKGKGAMLKVQLTEDTIPYQLNKEFTECLEDEPAAKEYFNSLPKSFKNYYSKWIESAKTEPTRTKRIALAVSTLALKIGFGEMIRSQRKLKEL